MADEQRAVDAWTTAVDASAAVRDRLSAAVRDATAALDHTRPERAGALDPAHELWAVLGAPPKTRGGLAAWCGIGERVQAWDDYRLPARRAGRAGHGSRQRELASLLADAPAILEYASRLDPAGIHDAVADRRAWQSTIESARQGLVERRPAPTVDHDFGFVTLPSVVLR